MIDRDIRIMIQLLRSKGLTYNEICENLGHEIPKSTLSYICKDVKVPEDYINKQMLRALMNLKKAREIAAEVNNRNLQRRFSEIRNRAEEVLKSDTKSSYEKIHLAMLYKAEGSKYGSYRGLAMGSSEPSILRIYISLLEANYHKKRTDFRARVQYRADQDLEKLQEYWSNELSLPEGAFYRSSPDKRTIGKPTLKKGYNGVCVISCSGADIQLELDVIAVLYSEKIWGVSSFG